MHPSIAGAGGVVLRGRTGVYDPRLEGDCSVWLHAAPTDLTLVDSKVAAWNNRGSGADFIQAAASLRPVTTTSPSGLTAPKGSGGSFPGTHLYSDGAIALGTAITVACVIRTHDQSAIGRWLMFADVDRKFLVYDNGTDKLHFFVAQAAPALTAEWSLTALTNDGTWHYAAMIWDGTLAGTEIHSVTVDGAPNGTEVQAANTTAAAGTHVITLFTNDIGDSPSNTAIADMIIWNKALDAGGRNRFNAYGATQI
jgi:hypothetical protein